jgi:hypothetical protein
MAEKIVSPGVFTKEIDQTFLPAAVADIGAAIIGPTVKGKFMIPTVVTSYSEYQAIFGDTFKSGSGYYQFLTSHTAESYLKHSDKLTVVRIPEGNYGPATAEVHQSQSLSLQHFAQRANQSGASGSAMKIYTLSDGTMMNSSASVNCERTAGLLDSGSKDNLRWEISSNNYNKGTFTLLVRRGDDISKRKQILETWKNLSMDPNASNYVEKVVGNQQSVFRGAGTTDPYLQLSGSYPNKSKYIRVEVRKAAVDYLDENGNIRDSSLTANIPVIQSGSFFGGSGGGMSGDGAYKHPMNMYDNISVANSQGLKLSLTPSTGSKQRYLDALALLNNQDEYDINMIMTPGIVSNGTDHTTIATKAIDVCESRGDAFYVMDNAVYNTALTTVTTEAETRDSNYAATYHPWIQINDNQLGKAVWVPPSVVIPGIYAFNDKVAHPWFAPAGLNRGGIDSAIQAARKLTHANRDDLYDSNVNPVATFPGQGVTVWGQKTLQKKASALDRINVRRLLIKLKKFIASSSRFLVFEQNNSKTRSRFLNIVNPFLEQVQSNSGLNAFRVVMDESNNTPDVVDRNVLYGQIFVQPTRTAEFIVLDFTVQPTGATFPE